MHLCLAGAPKNLWQNNAAPQGDMARLYPRMQLILLYAIRRPSLSRNSANNAISSEGQYLILLWCVVCQKYFLFA